MLHAAGRDAEAAHAWLALTERYPDWPAPWSKLAGHYREAGRAEAAEASLRAGLDATGWAPALGEQLAMTLLGAGRTEDAIGVFETLHARHPDHDAVANNLAMLLVTHRDDPEDIARAGALVTPYADSRNPAYLDTVGWVRLRQGRVAEALELLQEAVRAAPGRPTQRYHLAVAYLESGDERAARRELDVALASDAPFPEREVARRWRERLASADTKETGR